MKKSTTYLTLLTAAFGFYSPLMAADPQIGTGETDGYKLVWQDLFDGESLDPLCWNIEVNGNGGGNNELQYYTDREENVHIGDDGKGNRALILTAIRGYYKGKTVTSGRVTTQNRVAFTHGKMEASIRLPKTARGLWPAFWMMGDDHAQVGWPRSGETDILEMGHSNGFGGNEERYFNGASHWGPQWPQASSAKSLNAAYSLQDDEYHLFTIIWDEQGYSMYYDLDRNPSARPYYSLSCPVKDTNNEWDPGNYFHKPNFILFNLAVGGDFPGIHNIHDVTALNEDNNYQASMYINYVKIYQKGNADDYIDYVAQPSGVENIAMESSAEGSIRLGESEVTADSAISLYAADGRKVAYSEDGSISLISLPAGIYIAYAAGKSLKIKI